MKHHRWRGPCLRLAEYLADRIRPWDRKGSSRLCESLELLESGRRGCVREYYIRKFTQILRVICLLVILLAAVSLYLLLHRDDRFAGTLLRPERGRGSRSEQLIVSAQDMEETESLDILISQRRFRKEEVAQLLKKAQESFTEMMLGENESVDMVRSDLILPDTLENGTVSISYVMVPYGIVDEEGHISGEVSEEGEIVEISATFSCQGTEQILRRSIHVFPEELSPEKAFWRDVKRSVETVEEEMSTEEYFTLPEEVDGKRLTWKYTQPPWLKLLLLMLICVPAGLWMYRDYRVREQMKYREHQLMLDYGELMWKITMLLGAGLTMRSTFFRIAEEYGRSGTKKRYAYEEVVRTCREMKSGTAEDAAYEAFGKRCGLLVYKRIGMILSQNLKKGSKGLREMLEKESEASMEERTSMAVRTGERAGTMLLMPMMAMLGIVLIILMIPAFTSF